MMTYLFNILQDGFFAAIAAIGFASISNPPRQAYKYCALIAALGHATRYVLTHNAYGEMHLIGASFIASLVIGVLVGALAGYIAGRFMGTETSFARNAVLGVLGSFVGEFLFGLVGIHATGSFSSFVISILGACVCIWVDNKFLRK